jgi:hypothetical protein
MLVVELASLTLSGTIIVIIRVALTSVVGSFCMELHAQYPGINLVVQDKDSVIQQAVVVWNTKNPSAVFQGKVKFAAHDFFKKNPVVGADIYWLRHIV